MKFINIHTHSELPAANAVVNVHFGFDEPRISGRYSFGMHPWYLQEESVGTEWQKLKTAASQSICIAIGECGLDKVCETDYELQKRVFIQQIELANEVGKPLIIHCVRAFDDVLFLLKKHGVNVPVIFHGFNKNEKVASQILNAGYLLSFGQKLMFESSSNVLENVPLTQFFLETDDGCVAIEEVYRMAAQIKDISLEQLSEQIQNNANRVFGENTLGYE